MQSLVRHCWPRCALLRACCPHLFSGVFPSRMGPHTWRCVGAAAVAYHNASACGDGAAQTALRAELVTLARLLRGLDSKRFDVRDQIDQTLPACSH